MFDGLPKLFKIKHNKIKIQNVMEFFTIKLSNGRKGKCRHFPWLCVCVWPRYTFQALYVHFIQHDVCKSAISLRFQEKTSFANCWIGSYDLWLKSSCLGITLLTGICFSPINHFPLLAASTLVGPDGGHKITTTLCLGQLLQHSGQAQDFNHEVVGSEPARYGELFPSFLS